MSAPRLLPPTARPGLSAALNQFLIVCVGLANFFSEEQNSKHFRLCRPHMVSVAYSWLIFFFPTFKNVKILLSSRAIQKQASGEI